MGSYRTHGKKNKTKIFALFFLTVLIWLLYAGLQDNGPDFTVKSYPIAHPALQ